MTNIHTHVFMFQLGRCGSIVRTCKKTFTVQAQRPWCSVAYLDWDDVFLAINVLTQQ